MKIHKLIYSPYLCILALVLMLTGCKTPTLVTKSETLNMPAQFAQNQDTLNSAKLNWKTYFTDPNLNALIDEALQNNQELNIMMQEIAIAQNEIRIRKGEYLPFVGLNAGADVEKVGRYTSQGANDANTEIRPGVETPEPLSNFKLGAYATWEIDIWNKLHNAKKAAIQNYLSSVAGKDFMKTNLIAEIAHAYYELLALDNQLATIQKNIEIQTNALAIVKIQKEAARVNQLAVKRFEAQVMSTKSMAFDIQQKIVETENAINYLVGRYPQTVQRDASNFLTLMPTLVQEGIPSQLLENRADVKQAEFNLAAAKLNVKVAKARFYPSLGISAGVGFEAFDSKYLLNTPQSLLYSFAGDLVAPLVNRNAIKATYLNANAAQIQAIYAYQQTVLNAYVEVANQLSKIKNVGKSFDLKTQQVDALNESVVIANDLFKSARADYMEVLLTQRDALESKFELLETKKEQLSAVVSVYQALGGGWQ